MKLNLPPLPETLSPAQLDGNQLPVKKAFNLPELQDRTATTPIEHNQLSESKFDIDVPLGGDFQELRGERQPGYEKIGAGLVNSASELVLGTLKNASYLLDFPQYVDVLNGSERDFSNFFADATQKMQDRLEIPIYKTQGDEGFSPLHAGWWGSNMPSMVSTISMAIPATMAVKGMGAAARLMGGTKLMKAIGMGVGEARTLEGITGAIYSRQMESIAEGAQTFQQAYTDALKDLQQKYPELPQNQLDEKAKQIASEAAVQNYKLNWLALAQDLPEYMLMFGAFGNSKKLAKLFSGEVKNVVGVGASEGIEEGFQFITDKEARRNAMIKAGLTPDDNSSILERSLNYAKDGDFWTSAFFGAIGGMGSVAIMNNKIKAQERARNEMYNNLLDLHKSIVSNDPDEFQKVQDNQFLSAALKHFQAGTLDLLRNDLENLQKADREFLENSPTLDSKDFKEKVSQRLQDLDFLEQTASSINNKLESTPELKMYELTTKLNQRLVERASSKLNHEINGEVASESISRGLSTEQAFLKKELIELASYTATGDKRFAPKIKTLQDITKSRIAGIIADDFVYPTLKTEEDVINSLSTSGDESIARKINSFVLYQKDIEDLKENLNKLKTTEGKKAVEDEIKKFKEEIQKKQDEIKNPPAPAPVETPTENAIPVNKTVQLVTPEGVFGGIKEAVVTHEAELADGSIEYTLEDGSKVSTNEGWKEVNASENESDIEKLNSPDHFLDMHKYNLAYEQEALRRQSQKTGEPIQHILDRLGEKAFPAHAADKVLNKILGTLPQSEYKKYIKLVGTLVTPTKYGDIVSLNKKTRLRGKRKTGAHIILRVTDPENSKNVYSLSHGYNPEFYEEEDDKGNWSPINFDSINLERFKQLFTFRFEEVTNEAFERFKANWRRAKQFNDQALIYVQQNIGNKKEIILPENVFALDPRGALDFIGNETPIDADKFPEFKNRAVIFTAAHSTNVVNGIDSETSPQGLERGHYYVEAKFPNGKIQWIRLFPATAKLTGEEATKSIEYINGVIADLKATNTSAPLDELQPHFDELLRGIDFFVQPKQTNLQVKFKIGKASNETEYTLKVVIVLEQGRGLDNPRQELSLTGSFKNLENLKAHLAGLYVISEFNGNKIQNKVGDATLRKNLPFDTETQKIENPLKQLASSTKKNIIKNWTASFLYFPENFEAKDQVSTEPIAPTEVPTSKEVDEFFNPTTIDSVVQEVSPKVADIERRRQELGLQRVLNIFPPDQSGGYRVIVKGDKYEAFLQFTGKKWDIYPKQKNGEFQASDPETGNALIINPEQGRKLAEKYLPIELVNLIEEAASIKGIDNQQKFEEGKIKEYVSLFRKEWLESQLSIEKERLEYYKSDTYPNKDSQARIIKAQEELIAKYDAELAALEQQPTSNQSKIEAKKADIEKRKQEGTNLRGTTYKGETTEKDGLKVTKYSEFRSDGKRISKGGRIMTPAEFIKEYNIIDQDYLDSLEGATEIRIYEVREGKDTTGISIQGSFPEENIEMVVSGANTAALETPTSTRSGKAEIERRRQEIKNNLKGFKVGRYTPSGRAEDRVIGDNIILEIEDALNLVSGFNKKLEKEDIENVNKILNFYYKGLTKSQLETLTRKYDNLKESFNKINAKYDAELAALKTKAPEFTPDQEAIYKSLLAGGEKEEDARRIALDKGTDSEFDKVTDQIDYTNAYTLDEAKQFVQDKFGNAFTVEDIDTLESNSKINGTRIGTVLGKVLYLTHSVSRTYTFHEAFHAVFNNLITPRLQKIYTEKIKAELNLSKSELQSRIDKLRKTSSQYSTFSNAQMEQRVYEEALSDKYADWQDRKLSTIKGFWSSLFQKIKNFINTLIGNPSIIHLFNQIDSRAFKNSNFKDSRTNEFDKIIPNTSPSQSRQIIYTIAAGVLNGENVTEENPSRILNAFNAYTARFDLKLPENIKFVQSLNNPTDNLLAMKKFYNKLLQNKDLIVSEVTRFLKSQGYREDLRDIEDFLEDNSEVNFDAMSSEYDPSIRVGAQIKRLLATTLYNDTDIFGRPVKSALPWREVYNRMLPVLSITNTHPDELMARLKAMGKYSPQISAFYNRIVQISGFDQNPNGVGTNGKNILTQLKKAFELDKILYLQAVDKGSSYDLFIENKRDLSETKVSKWTNQFLVVYEKILAGVKHKDRNLQDDLIRDLELLEKSMKGEEVKEEWKYTNLTLENKIFSVLNNLGITLEKPYLEFAFGASKEDATNRETLNNIYIISPEDIKNIRLSLMGNKQIPAKNIMVDQKLLIGKIAEADAFFDQFAFQKTYTDAENKKRYSYGLDSLLGVQKRAFKNIFRSAKAVNEFIEKNKEYWKHNAILNRDPEFVVRLMKNFETGLAYDLRVNDRGVTSRGINMYDALMYQHALFMNQNSKEYNGINSSPMVLNQFADKSQQMWGVLPVFNYYDGKEKKYTPEAEEDIWNLFQQEYKRLQGKYGEHLLSFKKGSWIHFPMFGDTSNAEAQSILEGAKTDLNAVKDRVLTLVKANIDEEVKDHLALLIDNKLSEKISEAAKKQYTDLRGYLYNFTLNQTLVGIAINQLLVGDYGMAKNFEDYVKRISMLNSSGFSYSKNYDETDAHRVIYIKDSHEFINPESKEKITETFLNSLSAKEQAEYKEWHKINAIDAQVYSSLTSYEDDLIRQGRINDNMKEVIKKLKGEVIVDGEPVFPTLKEIKDAEIDLIPSKQVTAGYDSEGRTVLHKMAVCYITPQLCAKWDGKKFVPKEGKETLFKMMQLLENNNITHIVPESAAKLFFPKNSVNINTTDIEKDINESHIYKIPNIYRRLQGENDSKETGKITASNQIENILGSEIVDQAKLDEHNKINAKMRTQVYDFVLSILVKDGDRADADVILKKFRNIIEESTPDNQMLEMLEAEGTKMKYDSNMPHLHSKFQALFLSTFKDVFRQKVPGVKFTAMSSHNYNILDPVTKQYRPLRGMQHKNGVTIPAEVIVSRKWADANGFKVGDEIILFRVPSQSYHSIGVAKVVDLLPDAYGDTIMAPSDFVWLMGMDFDVDALYSYKKSFFTTKSGRSIEYGKEHNPEEKFEGFVADLFKNNSYFKAEFAEITRNNPEFAAAKERIKSDRRITKQTIGRVETALAFLLQENPENLNLENISNELLFLRQNLADSTLVNILEDAIRATLNKFNLPKSPEALAASGLEAKNALTNKLFDLKYQILSSPELQDAFSQPLAEKSSESINLGKENDVTPIRLGGSPLSIVTARQAAVQSKGLVGTAVNGNSFIQFATQVGLEVSPEYALNFDGQTFDSFANTDKNQTRLKFDKASMTLGSIVDGMKKPFAKYLNYDFNTVNKVMIMYGLNIPEETIDAFFIQPSLKAITEKLNKTRRLTNPDLPYLRAKDKEEILLNALFSEISKNLTREEIKELSSNINTKDLLEALKLSQAKNYTKEYYTTQYKVLLAYEKLMQLDAKRGAVNRILSTNRSLGSDTSDFYKVLEGIATLTPTLTNPEVYLNALDKIAANPVLYQNITYVYGTLDAFKHYDLSETNFGKKIFDAFDLIFKSGVSEYEVAEIKRVITASLQLAVLRNSQDLSKLASTLISGEKSLSTQAQKYLLENPNNYFARLLTFSKSKRGYDLVQMDSRTQFTETVQDRLLDSFGRIAEKNPELAQEFFNYLTFKDNLLFRNNSFVKYIIPEMFLPLAKASQEINRILAKSKVDEAEFKSITGVNTRQLVDMTIENYIRHSINKSKLKRLDEKDLKGLDFGDNIFTVRDSELVNYKDDEGNFDMPLWIKIVKPNTDGMEEMLMKKISQTDNTATYEPKTYYGDSERLPYALTPAQNEMFEKLARVGASTSEDFQETPNEMWNLEPNPDTNELDTATRNNQNIISARGKMTFSYGNNKRTDIKATTTFEAIKNGERTATTRYESDGHIDYWKKLKAGDIIEWESSTGEKVLVEVTKPLHKLLGSGKTAEQWSKLEGWSVNYFNTKVKPKLNEAWQIEYKIKSNPDTSEVASEAAPTQRIQGINISTKSTDPLGKRLTNPNWYAKDLMDVEAPYKANASKIKAPKLNAEDALKYDMNLMYNLQVQKFQKNPELIDEINARGGLQFILNSEHTVGVKGSRWEGKGLESNFIKVLAQSYTKVAKDLGKFIENNEVQVEEVKKGASKINFQEEQTTGYRNRTIKNASADATIAIAVDFTSAGERLTKNSVLGQNKKYIPVDANKLEITQERVDKIVEQLNNSKTNELFKEISLNIAGNGIYTMKGKYTQEQVDQFTYNLLKAIIESPKLEIKIGSIRTGGQTGFDEAGAKAGVKLGISTTILAPKGWTFRNLNGVDISNEQQFKDRFKYVPPQYSKVSEEQEGIVASEKTVRDLAARISHRIGIPVRFESDRSKEYKGKLENGTAIVNLAYATLDTPIHEILGHPIIRAIRGGIKTKEQWENSLVYTFRSDGEEHDLSDAAYSKYYNQQLNSKQLYQNLLKELEYGRGKEVLDRIKRDYVNKEKSKSKNYNLIDKNNNSEIEIIQNFGNYWFKEYNETLTRGKQFNSNEELESLINKEQNKHLLGKYTLEEQQEEAIVELLGLMTAEKLDAVKDGKLISLLKRLLKEVKAFVRSLLNQKEVEIDKLPDNMTLGDLSDLLAYSNSKLILPGYEVTYTTPDNVKFKTYQEASNHISTLAKNVKNVDLNNIKIPKTYWVSWEELRINSGNPEDPYQVEYLNKDFMSLEDAEKFKEELENRTGRVEYLNIQIKEKNDSFEGRSFIEKNKEYEQSKEIIEEWKKVNNIQYNPEEIYSRGQEFSSVVGAYSAFDVNLMMQNLLHHIEDNEKAGGKFAISAFTKPIDKTIGHLEGGGGKIKFKIYPQSQDILWAANTDVYSGSVWDASEKVSKNKKSELLGVSYTKYPSLRNVNTVQPNLASIVDNLNHHHNELGITLTGNNFRLEYDEDIPYTTKKIIDGINKILDQKYGKLVKPDLSKKILKSEKIYEVRWKNSGGVIIRTTDLNKAKAEMQGDYTDAKGNKLKPEDVVEIVEGSPIEQIGIQPTQTNETLKESIDSVWNNYNKTKRYKDSGKIGWRVTNSKGESTDIFTDKTKAENQLKLREDELEEGWFLEKVNIPKEKEYTDQALINTKIAALKEVAKKYPRSLIRSEVAPIHRFNSNFEDASDLGFDDDVDLPFQKLSKTAKANTANTTLLNSMTLRDDIMYSYDEINSKMLEEMGYSREEIGEMLNKICK